MKDNKMKFDLNIQLFAEASKVFVPTLWSARLLAHLDKRMVFKNFFNTDYEGEISDYGDTVKINQIGDITIKGYTGADIDDAEDVTGVQQTLTIDQGNYFNFRVKDVLAAQSNVTLLDKAMARSAYALADVIDQDLAKIGIEGAGIKLGEVANPVVITVANAYDKLVDLGVLFDENNVSKADRKIALPAWYIGMISKDPRFTKDYKILENGLIEGATVGSFTIYMSNNVVRDTTDASIYTAFAAAPQSGQFANQISKTETYRPEKNFADAVKGLSLYGRKITEPKACAAFVIKQGA
ncbi:hypothetical protein [Erysipelothrix anatis]|uniref:hypothetical protein n=1 Tax=Erysipelothrix anatis TaxID=2683713 RepID=UPI001A9E565C|nr:hypothetical protein [Erysipelothrix anatis]